MRFSKMQGVGNDFVVVNAAEIDTPIALPVLAVQACDRNFGIGADGLLVVSKDDFKDDSSTAFRMRMFNPDGSEDMCGNGLRCVSLWAYRAGWLAGRTEFSVAVRDGFRTVCLRDIRADGRQGIFGVDMGIPQFAPADIPFLGTTLEANGARVVDFPLHVVDSISKDSIYKVTALNTGSTHTVIFGDTPPSEETFQRVSPRIENHPLFPERTSVLWATPQDNETEGNGAVAVRIWERGAGETWGCGTGACAVGVAAVLHGLRQRNTAIPVVSKGGTLQITWPGKDAPVEMVGPAELVFDGEFPLDAH